MPRVTIGYGSTGSNTLASGSATPATAVTGTAAAHTGGLNGTTITLTNTPDLSGVSAGDVLWINDAAGGRRLTEIVSANDGADTVVVIDSFNIAAGSAVDYAIGGGDRLTPYGDTTRSDFMDGLAGWRFELGTGTYTFPAGTTEIALPAVGDLTDGRLEIVARAAQAPVLAWTEDAAFFHPAGGCKLLLRGLTIQNTVSTFVGSRGVYVTAGSCDNRVIGCTFNTPASCIDVSAAGHLSILDCDLTTTQTTHGINLSNGRVNLIMCGNNVHDCGSNGLNLSTSTTLQAACVIGNVFDTNGGDGINFNGGINNYALTLMNNIFYNNAGSGLEASGTLQLLAGNVVAVNNIFQDNGDRGILVTTPTSDDGGSLVVYEDFNAFFSNTTAETSGLNQGANDITLTGSPFTDAAGGDFSLNATAGAGADCRDAGFGRTS